MKNWNEELNGYESTLEEGYKLFHIPERDLKTLLASAEAYGKSVGREYQFKQDLEAFKNKESFTPPL